MLKKKCLILICVFALLCINIACLPVYAAVNPSVTLNPAPSVVENIVSGVATVDKVDGDDTTQNGVLVFGQTTGGGSSAGTTSSYKPPVQRKIDLSQLKITSLFDLETRLTDETLEKSYKEHLLTFDELNSKLKSAQIFDYVSPQSLAVNIAGLNEYVDNGTVSAKDLVLYNLFDVWFPECEDLNGECVMLSFDLTAIETGIVAFVQYNGTDWTVIPSTSIMNSNGIVTVTMTEITPIALFTISQTQIDNILNPPTPEVKYMGEAAEGVIWSLVAVAVAELIAIFVAIKWFAIKAYFKKRR